MLFLGSRLFSLLLLFSLNYLRMLFWIIFLSEEPYAKARLVPCSFIGDCYLKMLIEEFIHSLLECDNIRRAIFMQNGTNHQTSSNADLEKPIWRRTANQ